MSLKKVYQRFLADPKSASLAADASLIYITTTTRFDGAEAVSNHLTKQESIVKRKSQEIVGAVEGSDSLCLDIETTLEFLSGGGAYLPSLDDNFLADRVATFPTIHIVRFNSQQQIQNVRVYWDQGSLLKQVEVIGTRGRAWPIRDAKDQTRLIKSVIASTPENNGPAPSAPSASSASSASSAPLPPSNRENAQETPRPTSPQKKHIKDPYAAESLFDLLSPEKDRAEPVAAPRAPASAKPPPRDLGEIFVRDDDYDADAPDATPSKPKVVAPKIGAGKNFRPSRIFDDDDEVVAAEESQQIAPKIGAGKNFRPSRIFDDDEVVAAEESQQIAYKTNPKRFDHFELGADNSQRELKQKAPRPMSRPVANWNFEDFTTPEKPKRQPRGEEVRHFGWSDDEPLQETPPARPHVHHARPDADTHFHLADPDDAEHRVRVFTSYQNKGMGLYKDHLYHEEEEKSVKGDGPLSVVHNGVNRKKDFDSHWSNTDSPPAENKVSHENQKPLATDRLKAVKMMESSWESYDQSPQPSKVAHTPPQRHISRQVNEKSWDMGDDGDY